MAAEEKTFACLLCSKRKIKCDKLKPLCSTCKRLKHECIYQAPAPPKKRQKLDSRTERLERYETILSRHGLLSKALSDASPSTEAIATLQGTLQTTQDNHRYVDNTLWGAYQTAQDTQDDEFQVGAGHSRSQALFAAAVLGHPPTIQEVTACHPSPDHICSIWDTFVDRVDPIIKMVHVPTTSIIIDKAKSNTNSLSRPEQCICFAIYFTTISAFEEAECKALLGRERSTLAAEYLDSLQYALFSADFLRTTNLQVLQAYVLFLLVIKGRFDAQLFWIMTGVAVRIAQRIGIHRDGSQTGLPPFETEMYRRLFWQLPPLDGFAGQFAGTGIALDTLRWDTKQASNVNDVDIWPGISKITERNGATDMLFFLAKSTFVEFYKDIVTDLQVLEHAAEDDDTKYQIEADKRIDHIEDLLETKLLRYCDPMEPIQFNASLLARVAVLAVRFRVRMPRAKVGKMTAEEIEKQSHLAKSVIQRLAAAHTTPILRKYVWHTKTFIIWDILIWFANHLTSTPTQSENWKVLGTFCESHPDFVSPRQPITFAIIKLILKAWENQAAGSEAPPMISRYQALLAGDMGVPDCVQKKVEVVLDNLPIPQSKVHDERDQIFDPIDQNFDWAFWDQLMDPETMLTEPL